MKLVSMKNTPKELAEEKKEMATPGYEMPEYPYGLNICLSEESIAKLDLAELPQAGDELLITAKVKVSRVSSVDTDRGLERGLDLQITEMNLEMRKDPADLANKMYKK